MNPTEPQAGAATGSAQLNVIFHGLWAFETTYEGPIIAYTPQVEHHKIAAGSHRNLTPLVRGAEHVLQNVRDQKTPTSDFIRRENVVKDNKQFDNKNGKLFCKVKLDPPPDDVKSVRLVNVKDKHPFLGKDGEQLNPDNVAMVQVFIYNVENPATVSLEPAGATPTQSNAGPWNLHIFAQPDNSKMNDPKMNDPKEDPLKHYEIMAAMFGLDIRANPAVPVFAAPSDPEIAGLTINDVLGLDEVSPTIGGGVSGSNCDGLVINNRQPPITASK